MRYVRKTKSKDNKKSGEKYKRLLPELIITVIGTVFGVVLTVGVTYCSEKNDKESMARKIAMMTIHNLDASVNSMSKLIGELNREDSIFRYIEERRATLEKVSPDTLDMFISAFYSHNVRPIDTSTEAIFSSNFDIWRNIDDPKVIGRIANCYSLMRKCGEEYDRFEKDKYNAFTRIYDSSSPSLSDSGLYIVNKMLDQSFVIRIIDSTPVEIALLSQLLESARELNNRNKSELKVSQKELDEIGMLM